MLAAEVGGADGGGGGRGGGSSSFSCGMTNSDCHHQLNTELNIINFQRPLSSHTPTHTCKHTYASTMCMHTHIPTLLHTHTAHTHMHAPPTCTSTHPHQHPPPPPPPTHTHTHTHELGGIYVPVKINNYLASKTLQYCHTCTTKVHDYHDSHHVMPDTVVHVLLQLLTYL